MLCAPKPMAMPAIPAPAIRGEVHAQLVDDKEHGDRSDKRAHETDEDVADRRDALLGAP